MTRIVRYRHYGRPWSLNAERSGSRGHGHWSKTGKLVKEWREAFYYQALDNRVQFRSAHVIVEVAMKPPLADTGNAYGTIKACIDGLVDASVLPGDGPKEIKSLLMMAPRKTGKQERDSVTITLIDAEASSCPSCGQIIRRAGDRPESPDVIL